MFPIATRANKNNSHFDADISYTVYHDLTMTKRAEFSFLIRFPA
jgi:hypothetical protein